MAIVAALRQMLVYGFFNPFLGLIDLRDGTGGVQPCVYRPDH